MTEQEEKKTVSAIKAEPLEAEHQSAAHLGRKTKRTIYHINPLGMRIVVRIPKDQNMSEGGLYLPEGAKEAMVESILCEVIEVASALDNSTEEETNVSGVPLGSRVLISRRAGIKVPWDDQLRIVETKDVLATVEQIDLS